MRSVGIVLGIVVALMVVDTADAAPTQWVAGNGHWYEVILGPLPFGPTWVPANAAANASVFMGVNGHLATITSAAENAFIVGLGAASRNGAAHIGLTDAASEGTFVWVTGEPFVYSNWFGGEPNNSGNEDYVEINLALGLWNDIPANARRSYIVEWEPKPQAPEPASMMLLAVGALLVFLRRS